MFDYGPQVQCAVEKCHPTERRICFDAISAIAAMQRYEYPMPPQQGSVRHSEYLQSASRRNLLIWILTQRAVVMQLPGQASLEQ